ncbi:MAG TPA: hypothetical protein VK824_04770, partial [Planctomycetota bacterium]|nr:hypothetical protein [Planctomycetota bacterium]
MKPSPRQRSIGPGTAAAILAAATLAMFADVLFSAAPRVLSHGRGDLVSQYVHWRTFGFGELSRGNLALWNPHVYLGSPYLGGSQSALLYPPNWIHLALPMALAVNWGVALHVFLAGFFTFLWARRRGLLPVAALLSGLLLMFGGAFFLHIYAGHLSNLCTMAWAPLLLLAIDGWLDVRRSGWIVLGAAAIALMILAGHPQYVYYTAITVALYGALRLAWCPRRLAAVAGLLAMPALGAGLAAAQLLPSLDAAGESVRSGGTSFEFASTFSFPPENLLTLLSPRLFGDGTDVAYWGRTYLWEVGLFMGLTGLFLAGFGALRGERTTRRFAFTMLAVLLLLALGSHTPLFRLLYDGLPGFDSFRGTAKFGFHASLFLALLAGIGLDRLIRAPGELRRPAAMLAASAVVSAAAATWILSDSRSGDPAGNWARLMQAVWSRADAMNEAYLDQA